MLGGQIEPLPGHNGNSKTQMPNAKEIPKDRTIRNGRPAIEICYEGIVWRLSIGVWDFRPARFASFQSQQLS
jgi:hypothetical protein